MSHMKKKIIFRKINLNKFQNTRMSQRANLIFGGDSGNEVLFL